MIRALLNTSFLTSFRAATLLLACAQVALVQPLTAGAADDKPVNSTDPVARFADRISQLTIRAFAMVNWN